MTSLQNIEKRINDIEAYDHSSTTKAIIKDIEAIIKEREKKAVRKFVESFFPIEDQDSSEILESIDDCMAGDGFYIWCEPIRRELEKYENNE